MINIQPSLYNPTVQLKGIYTNILNKANMDFTFVPFRQICILTCFTIYTKMYYLYYYLEFR